MAIAVTENAARQLRNQFARRGKGPAMGLPAGVRKVGCSGFACTVDHVDAMRRGDRQFEAHDVKISLVKPL
jgi:iron-sulfur cluster assembly protein